MQKLNLFFCLVLLAVHQIPAKVFQIQSDCSDFEKLCGQRIQGIIPYKCDVSCTKFIVCYTMNNKPMSILKNCPDGQYYNSSHKMCTRNKPENCS